MTPQWKLIADFIEWHPGATHRDIQDAIRSSHGIWISCFTRRVTEARTAGYDIRCERDGKLQRYRIIPKGQLTMFAA